MLQAVLSQKKKKCQSFQIRDASEKKFIIFYFICIILQNFLTKLIQTSIVLLIIEISIQTLRKKNSRKIRRITPSP